jgi:hypothetical protein
LDYVDGLGRGGSETFTQSTSTLNNETAHGHNGNHYQVVTAPDSGQDGNPPDSQVDDASQVLKRISRSLVLDRVDKYLNHPADAERISSELEAFCRTAEKDPESVHARFLTWYQQNRHLKIKGWTLETLCRVVTTTASTTYTDFKTISNRETLLTRLWDTATTLERRLLVTEQGHVGMAPLRARKGDVVCLLFGYSVPIVLRKVGDDDDGFFKFIGECYLDGFMASQSLMDIESGKRIKETFRLR